MTETNIGLSIEPIIKYPSEAEVGKIYLLTVDLRPLDFDDEWPYHDIEEQTIHCIISSAPLFRCSPLGDPCVLIHRFGGSYGPARFRLTAAATEGEGTIRITLVNNKGLPIDVIETPTIHVRQRGHVSAGTSSVRGADIIATVDNLLFTDYRAKDVNIATQQTITMFFDGAQGERGADLLNAYLDALIADSDALRLARLSGRPQSSIEQAQVPVLGLQEVYTSLTTDGPPIVVYQRTRRARQVRRLHNWLARHQRGADTAAPECVRLLNIGTNEQARRLLLPSVNDEQTDLNMPIAYRMIRPELAIEAIYTERKLVLLSDPGNGKTSVLRYLALRLARRLRGEAVIVSGWPDDNLPIPILCPLVNVAAALERHSGSVDNALWQVLGDLLDGEHNVRSGLRDFLRPALRNGSAILLFDGLDELPAGPRNDGLRLRVAEAIQRLAAEVNARIVVTSRVLPYRAEAARMFPYDYGWRERTIQPLTLGQVRTFVYSWYSGLAQRDPDLAIDSAEQRATALINKLVTTDRLRPLVQSPLLLTMIALLDYSSGGYLPRDRTRLYDECVQLLLERWEPVRTPSGRGQSSRLQQLLARLPSLEIDKLRDVIHALAFEVHDAPPTVDGRNRIDHYRLMGRLIEFFKRLGSTDPAGNAEMFLEVVREEAGLLVALDEDTYAFPHLTFQEYLAACWLADQANMSELAYRCWQGTDRERWRTVLLLMSGRLRQKGQKDVERDGVPWLDLLISPRIRGQTKPPTQRRFDTVLAALSYTEIGGRDALVTSMRDLVPQVEIPLRAAIVALLGETDSAIPILDRITAAGVLANLGDPRFPYTLEQWRSEPFSPEFGRSHGYWCALPAGTYLIGGWDDGAPSAEIALPAFWIGRFPVTIVQFTPFVEQGYAENAARWWTPEGWRWKQDEGCNHPLVWDDPRYTETNQPVISVSWYEATAFCAWLTEQLIDVLPEGFAVRLPSEAEWEATASNNESGARRVYPWGNDEPTPERAISNQSNLNTPAPVGCCPAGMSVCGALDLAGNVWEWTTSSNRGYPSQSASHQKDFLRVDQDISLRGGSWKEPSSYLRCGSRRSSAADDRDDTNGFRVVIAPRSL